MTRGGRVRATCVGAHPLYDGTLAVRFALEGVAAEGLSACAHTWGRRPHRAPTYVLPAGSDVRAACGPTIVSVHVPEGSRAVCLGLRGRGESGIIRSRVVIREEAWRLVLASWLSERTNAQDDPAHDAWMRAHKSSSAELTRQRDESRAWPGLPLVSIVTPVFRTPEPYLRAFLDSILAQTYENFELIIVNASGSCPTVEAVLSECHDSRVRVLAVENGGIASNTNVGIAAARGDYVGFVDHDDFIEPDALFRYVEAIRENPELDLLFCDEDLYGGEPGCERYYGVRFKPGWDPDLLLTHNYVCHLLMVSRWALERTERSGDDVTGAQDYDLTLKVAEVARGIRHIPRVLYHWREHPGSTAVNRDSKPYALEAGRLSVERHLCRTGVRANVVEGAHPFSYRVRYAVPEDVSVGVVVLGDEEGARRVTGLLLGTSYVLDVASVPRDVAAHPDELSAAVRGVRGEYVLLIGGGSEGVCPELLTELLGPLQRPDVACTGPLLLDPDDVVRACGLIGRPDGSFGCAERGLARRDIGYMTLLVHAHGCLALPAEGIMLRRADFEELGGLRTCFGHLAVQDFCLRLREHGWRCVVQPYAPLCVAAGVAGDLEVAAEAERNEMTAAHPWLREGDVCLNPRLSRMSDLYQLPCEERA